MSTPAVVNFQTIGSNVLTAAIRPVGANKSIGFDSIGNTAPEGCSVEEPVESEALRGKALSRPASPSLEAKSAKDLPHKREGSIRKVARANCKELRRRQERIENNIHKAARLELAYLNKAAEARERRDRFLLLHDAMSCKTLRERVSRDTTSSPITSRELQALLRGIKSNFRSMASLERRYLAKSKDIRTQRTKLTKLFEQTTDMLIRKVAKDVEQEPTNFPPILASPGRGKNMGGGRKGGSKRAEVIDLTA